MSILAYNGGAVVAMKGKGCVAIAADRRLGVRGHTICYDWQKIFEIGPHLFIGLPGLATDTTTVAQRLQFRVSGFKFTLRTPIWSIFRRTGHRWY